MFDIQLMLKPFDVLLSIYFIFSDKDIWRYKLGWYNLLSCPTFWNLLKAQSFGKQKMFDIQVKLKLFAVFLSINSIFSVKTFDNKAPIIHKISSYYAFMYSDKQAH